MIEVYKPFTCTILVFTLVYFYTDSTSDSIISVRNETLSVLVFTEALKLCHIGIN